jgi:ketosteroid isomerase-like protein
MDGAELMRTIAAAFEKSDLQPLLDAIHPDIVWKTGAKSPGLFRFSGEYKKGAIRELLAQIAMDYTVHRFAPKDIISSGDIVWGLFDISLSFDQKVTLARPKIVEMEMAIRWRIKDGKIIEHQGFFDTVSLLLQQGQVSPDALTPQQAQIVF